MNTRIHTVTRVAIFSAIISISAFIRIPIGPVPLTMQTFAAQITGYCLGPRGGAAATLLYTAVGLAGIPVFASGGGVAYVLSPTFGYILGFTLCAVVTGFFARFNRQGSVLISFIIMLTGLVGIYTPGVLWLIVALHWIAEVPASVATLLKMGLFIPLIGDFITTIPAAVLSVRLRKILS
ncbi:MAG TPA: biotin transporter BioY [Anaerolineae bacterium]|nr:biotin transporter BioY [Anaerolineae bacterium]